MNKKDKTLLDLITLNKIELFYMIKGNSSSQSRENV